MDKAERGAQQTINRLKRFNIAGETIMDIGANVGHVSRWLIDNGAKRVVSYEPHPLAFKQLQKRCKDGELVNAALLTKKGTIQISTSQKDNDAGYYCNSSIMACALPVHFDVDVIPFVSELKRVKPTALKIDVEGSEYDLLLSNDIPRSVKWISMEVHKLNAIGAPLFAALVNKLGIQGFGMSKLQPSVRQNPGSLKTFWGFMQVDFSRDYVTSVEDWAWVVSMLEEASNNRKTSRIAALQILFDKEFPR